MMKHLIFLLFILAYATTAVAQSPDECGVCNGVSHRDSCLLGGWETNRNGPAEWLERQGVPMRVIESTTYRIDFQTDGRYVIHPYAYDFSISHSGHTLIGGAETTGGTGCWSADGVDLNLCHHDGGPHIFGQVRFRGMVHSVNRPMFNEAKTIWNYSCGGSLRLTIPTDKRHAPITTQMFRPGMAPPGLGRRLPD